MAQPNNFISISELCPSIKIEASYATTANFTGEVVPGYKKVKAFISKEAGVALCKAQTVAEQRGMTLKIFDGYRPVKAVTFFQDWAKREEENHHIKKIYYPKYTRQQLFEQGYIANQSSHSRGGTLDLTLVNLKTGKDVDMGTIFDYFDEHSWTASLKVNEQQRANRQMLKELMESQGFKNYHQEWWHFSLIKEPYPDQYFDFDIE